MTEAGDGQNKDDIGSKVKEMQVCFQLLAGIFNENKGETL